MTPGETQQAIEAVFRIERARLVAGLARILRDVDRAEELAQDALVIALSEWPKTKVPANPGAWLMTAAKRRAIDAIRRDKMRERKREEIARELDGTFDGVDVSEAMIDDPGDELLGLIFTACHPVLSADARAALTLRVVGGLTTHGLRTRDGPAADRRYPRRRHPAQLRAAAGSRADFLFRAGRLAEARSEFEAAAKLTRNARERAFLLARADACD